MKTHRGTGRDSVKQRNSRRKTYLPGNTALPSHKLSIMESEEESVLRLKARQSAKASSILLLLILSLMIFDSEIHSESVNLLFLNTLRVLVLLLNMLQIGLIYKYYKTKLEEKKARMEVCIHSKLCDDPELFRNFTLESGLCLLCVPPFVGFKIVMPDLSQLSFADIVLILSLSKSYLWVKLLYEFSSRNTERTKFYSKRFNLGKGWKFILKSYITDYPGLSILFLSLLLFLMLSFVMDISESSLSIWESFWLIGVTGISLGYGDFVPHSFLGRSVSFFSAVFGIFLHSFSLMFLRKHLEMTIQEERFYDKVKFAKKDLQVEATLFIQAWWKYIRKSTKKAPRLGYLRSFAMNFRKFTKKRTSALLEKQKTLKLQLIEANASVSKVFELSHNKLSNTRELLSKAHAIVRDSHSVLKKVKRIWDINAQASPWQFRPFRKDLDMLASQRHSSGRAEMKIKRDMALVKHVSKNSYTFRDVSSQYSREMSTPDVNRRTATEHYIGFSSDSVGVSFIR